MKTMRVLCFGELLLRLGAPGRELWLQSPRFDVHVGGAEANVAVSLAQFGHAAAVASVLPHGPLGDAVLGELRRHGVDVAGVARRDGRLGLYFLATGAGHRPSEVLYDRAYSAFAQTPAAAWNWPALLAGVDRLHVSGVTPALGADAAEATLAACQAARAQGARVVFDGNYRARLWQGREAQAPAIIRALMAQADLIFADHRDIAVALDWTPPAAPAREQTQAAALAAFDAFPHLQLIASTVRSQRSVDQHRLGAWAVTRGGDRVEVDPYDLDGIVDRIGGGDAFAAGFLHAQAQSGDPAQALRFGLAAACLKHAVPGDFNRVGAAEVEALLAEGRFDVRR